MASGFIGFSTGNGCRLERVIRCLSRASRAGNPSIAANYRGATSANYNTEVAPIVPLALCSGWF